MSTLTDDASGLFFKALWFFIAQEKKWNSILSG